MTEQLGGVGTGSATGPGSRNLSVSAAARRVGVSPSTLRTWERRYGLVASGRSDGGHRRYSLTDIAAMQRMRHLIAAGMATGIAASVIRPRTPDPSGTAPPVPSPNSLRLRLNDAIDRFDVEDAASAAATVVDELGTVAAWTQVFVPELQRVGDRWESTGRGVEREHLAATAIRAALIRPKIARGGADSDARVLAAATPHEGHTLPLDALAAALSERGVRTCVLGTVPRVALRAAISDYRPAVVVLWARSRETTDSRLLTSLLERAPVLCAAGPGWNPGRLPAVVEHLHDLPSAVADILAWVGTRATPDLD